VLFHSQCPRRPPENKRALKWWFLNVKLRQSPEFTNEYWTKSLSVYLVDIKIPNEQQRYCQHKQLCWPSTAQFTQMKPQAGAIYPPIPLANPVRRKQALYMTVRSSADAAQTRDNHLHAAVLQVTVYHRARRTIKVKMRIQCLARGKVRGTNFSGRTIHGFPDHFFGLQGI
tara:strand:+ start:98 stop:610 length:513 start_codon:yes stop_codon:yes gene_type:complete